MVRGLRSLEQSLKSGRSVCPAAGSAPEGASGLSALQEQIEIVRGQRISPPSGSLRALEQRVLGCHLAHSPMVAAYSERQTLRLDQEQLAPAHMPYAPDAYDTVPPQTLLPQKWPPQAISAQSPQAYSSQSYAPEFSAPDTGRFHVESFADNPFGNDDGDELSIPSMPTFDQQPSFQAPNQVRTQAPSSREPSLRATPHTGVGDDTHGDNLGGNIGGNNINGNNGTPVFDDSDWISAAQNERPAKITAASKQSLNPSLALAKNDFERELAAILGTEVAPVEQAPDPLFNPNAAQQPTQAPTTPAKSVAEPEVAHPNHSVFDQMGLAMRYANSFDLGNVSLKDRFEHFEKDLEEDRSPAYAAQPARAQSMSSPFVDPMNLDEFDLVAELAEIGVANPNPAAVGQAPQASPSQASPPQVSPPQASAPQVSQAQPETDAQPAATAPVVETDSPVKPRVSKPDLNANAPITPKPINRTETTAGDDHE